MPIVQVSRFELVNSSEMVRIVALTAADKLLATDQMILNGLERAIGATND